MFKNHLLNIKFTSFFEIKQTRKKTIHAKHESESQTPYLYINLSKKKLEGGIACAAYMYYILNMDKNPLKNHKHNYT